MVGGVTDGSKSEMGVRVGDGIKNEIKEERIYIFGAHSRARTLAAYLRFLHPDISVEAFLYDNEEPNPEEADGVPVRRIDEGDLCMECPVYLGTRGVYHEAVTERLRTLGFGSIHPVTAELDRNLRNEYLKKYFAGTRREFVKIDDLEPPTGDSMEPFAQHPSAAVYVVRSAGDRRLKEPYADRPYEKPIQAGAALTSERLSDCGITDDAGENISARNRQFCELTALYWIWKHAKEDVIGLSHYRRRFLLPDDWQGRVLANGVDAILPVPLYVAPSVSGNYRERHDASDWDCMMDCLKKRDPQEHCEAEVFFGKNLYSPCNMFIMRREVLDELCGWLFPILFKVAEKGGTKEDGYQNRYPGFLSERLISFFFEKNRYRMVYADKNFLP